MNTYHHYRRSSKGRGGKLLVLLALLMPILFGVVGLVLDGGVMLSTHRDLQHGVDAAATAAAFELRLGKSASIATSVATDVLQSGNDLPDATVTVNIPPGNGPYAGRSGHVEVMARQTYRSRLMGILDGVFDRTLEVRAVAGVEEVTADAAIVILDPDPSVIQFPSAEEVWSEADEQSIADDAIEQSGLGELLSGVPVVGPTMISLLGSKLGEIVPTEVNELLNEAVASLPGVTAPAIIGGLEVEGIGRFIVDGSVLVNNRWGGVDENYEEVGDSAGPPYGVACMPLLPTTSMVARNLRVVGGVDNPDNYSTFDEESESPLQANRLPIADPLGGLPPPSLTSDGDNVSATVHDPADLVRIALPAPVVSQLLEEVSDSLPVLLRPLLTPLVTPLTDLLTEAVIEPGVYNSITVLAPLGGVRFEPGVYIIRGANPESGASLSIIGPVQAEGVLFYVTSSTDFNPSSGMPDAGQDPDGPPTNTVVSNVPSVWILPLLPGARITGLNDPLSPFHRLLVYQQRQDRRPIVMDLQQLIGGSDIVGTVYAKWGHLILIGGGGSHDLRFVSGTARVVTVTDTTLAPTVMFPPAQDVLLLE